MPQEPLDIFMVEHERTHAALDARLAFHCSMPSHGTLDVRVRMLEDFALQVRTLTLLLKAIFGASLIAAVTGIAALVNLVMHINATP